ncbi:MAG: sensor protein [Thiobacillus sp. 65-29]|nr:MAG: sensor protein [Thiobacillus sp. 65-29]
MERFGNTVCDAGLLQAILRESMTEVMVFDADTLRILYANPAVLRNLQRAPDALQELTPLELLAPEDVPAFQSAVALLHSGRRRRSRLRLNCRRDDGSLYPVDARLFLRRQGIRTLLVCIAHDETRHDAAEQALAHAVSDLRAIVASVPGMVFQVCRPPHGAPMLRHVSDQSMQLLGIKAATLRADPQRFFRMIHDDDRADYLAKLAAAAGGHLSFNWEGRLRMRAWKDVKWVSVRVSHRSTGEGDIWDGIMLNVTHSKLAEAEINQSRAQLRAMAAHIETAKEQERLRLAREVHDDLGGNLTAIKIALAGLTRRLPREDGALAERIAYLENLIDQTFDAAHRIAANLRPATLELGIVAALRQQCEQFTRHTGIDCRFVTRGAPPPLDADAAIAVYRIAQEALTNVAKHARASQVRMRLAWRNGHLVLTIADDGRGYAPARSTRAASGFGVLGMSERAAAFGGHLEIEAAEPRGTRVCLTLPLDAGKTRHNQAA